MNEEEIEEILDGNNSNTPDTTLRRSFCVWFSIDSVYGFPAE
jgi:hypothetical protein